MGAGRASRAIVLVLDSVGVGELPDAADYGDVGSDTLGNTSRAVDGLAMPNLGSLGLGNIIEIEGVPRVDRPSASWGKCREASAGKDTTTGHWEMMGVTVVEPFPTYPEGFPPEVMEEFELRVGRGWLGNYPASGTEIIQKLGDEHVRTGKPIVYTSADSVLQIAAHEDVIDVEELYAMCRTAREILKPPHQVGRVIARPFVSGIDPDGPVYVRTDRRQDFAVVPFGDTVLDLLKRAGHMVWGVGKIGDIFAWRGVDESPHARDNMDGFDKLVERVRGDAEGFVFCNLVDFDMLWGHRNDAGSYAAGLEDVDRRMPELLDAMIEGDLLIITADHGCDPTTA
jgi:phosphopentomutase